MPEAIRGGVRIHFLDEGEGRPVLLIHGHTLDLRIWQPLVGPLHEAGLRTLRYDLRGHGRSSVPPRGYHWADHAADAAAVLSAAGVDRAAVVGYSIGGGIALELVLTMAARVSRLALLSPVLPERPYEPEFFASLREVARAIRTDGVRAAMVGPWIESPLWRGSLDRPGVRGQLIEVVDDFPGADYLAVERDRVERDWNVPDRLPEIGVPTLAAVGELELPGFRAWAGEIAARIGGARLETMSGLGHLHVLEDPTRVAGLLIEHLVEG
jgi:pimeloyl-ACP methyl ester carboxylesterase